MFSSEARVLITREMKDFFSESDVLEGLSILEQLLSIPVTNEELAGVHDKYVDPMNAVFSNEVTIKDMYLNAYRFLNLEALFRLLIYHINPTTYQDIKDNRDGFSAVIRFLRINSQNYSWNSINPERYDTSSYKFSYICDAYNVRNADSHEAYSWSRLKLANHIRNVIYTLLFTIKLNKRDLLNAINRYDLQRADIGDYLNGLILSFRAKVQGYIDLESEEQLQKVDRIIIENHVENGDQTDEQSESARNVRKGTINDVRKHSVPEKRMLILGEAGTGKSTTLGYLAFCDAQTRKSDSTASIPVLVAMGLLTNTEKSLLEYIKQYLNVEMEMLLKLLEMGKINFFFDAINEIPQSNGTIKKTRKREIVDLMAKYPLNFFILTCRPDEDIAFPDVPSFTLLKMSDSLIEEFIKKNAKEEKTVETITKAIETNKKLRKIVSTPLMLSRLITIVDANGKIPDGANAIIGAFIETLFDRESNEKMTDFNRKAAIYFLRRIADENHQSNSTNAGMSEEQVLTYMHKCVMSYHFEADTFKHLALFFFFVILVRNNDQYQFAHQMYQDYFVAEEQRSILGV